MAVRGSWVGVGEAGGTAGVMVRMGSAAWEGVGSEVGAGRQAAASRAISRRQEIDHFLIISTRLHSML
ncbi:MAG: hypothetical protein A2Z49_05970 [Chloroflexi bacterium RBG_19FT_COMBO_56_12]|nr:MAG: hypothetical protein A2Z49_05970 [Chloroflexi bacterium RBG_19FT_COMBO_56_12]